MEVMYLVIKKQKTVKLLIGERLPRTQCCVKVPNDHSTEDEKLGFCAGLFMSNYFTFLHEGFTDHSYVAFKWCKLPAIVHT